MTAAAAILSELRARGVRLELRGDRLLWRAPNEVPGELLEAARQQRAELVELLREASNAPQIGDGDLLVSRERLGAVLIRSPRFGEVCLALDPCMPPELVAEEDANEDPRPVLLPEDLVRLRGRSPRTIATSLEVLRRFPGARMQS